MDNKFDKYVFYNGYWKTINQHPFYFFALNCPVKCYTKINKDILEVGGKELMNLMKVYKCII